MKVYLRYSPRSDRENALLIHGAIIKLGHEHVSDFVLKTNPEKFYTEDEKEWAKRYAASLKEMDEADICIFETSIPSTAMGQLAQLSIEKSKPTVLLYTKNNKPYFFRGLAEAERRALLLEYDPKNINEILDYVFTWAEEFLNTRFTLIFPPDIISYLNNLKRDGRSRSEYIRDLIRKDIKNKGRENLKK